MTSPKLLDIMRATKGDLTDALERAVTQAYEIGLRDGEAKAAVDVAALVAQRYGLPPPAAEQQKSAPVRREPPPAQTSERRKYGYGVVSGVVRNVIYAERTGGVAFDQIMSALKDGFGVILVKSQLREVMKRLSAAEEIKSDNRRWFPTPAFRQDLIVDYDPDGNEAPRGHAAGASKADEGKRPSSNENVIDLYGQPR